MRTMNAHCAAAFKRETCFCFILACTDERSTQDSSLNMTQKR